MDTTQIWPVRRPLLAAVGLALIPVVCTAGGSAAAQAMELPDDRARFVIAGAAAVSAAIGLVIAWCASPPLRRFGLRAPANRAAVWFGLPALAVVAITWIASGVVVTSVTAQLGILALVAAVAVNEELFFRGLVFAVCRGPRRAVVTSTVLFAVLHLASLAGGASPLYAGLQVAFAALFGLAAALVRLHTGSLLVPIVFHALYDGVSYLGGDALTARTLVGTAVACVVLAVWSAVMWRRIPATAGR